MQAIQAGIISKILDLVKTISQGLFNALDKLMDVGVKVDKQEEIDGGGVHFVLKVEGKKADMTVTPKADRKGYCDVVITLPGKSPIKLDNLPEKDVESEILKTLKDYFNLDAEFAPANSAKRLGVTLQKIETATGYDIRLKKITANYSPLDALAVLDTCAADDEFCDKITEAPVSFLIVDDGSEDLCVDMCEESSFASMNPYDSLVKDIQRVIVLFDMARIEYTNAQYQQQLTAIESLSWGLRELRDILMLQSKAEFNTVPNLFDVDADAGIGVSEFGLPATPAAITWATQIYDACVAYAAGFSDPVFQTKFYEALARFNDQLNYSK